MLLAMQGGNMRHHLREIFRGREINQARYGQCRARRKANAEFPLRVLERRDGMTLILVWLETIYFGMHHMMTFRIQLLI